MQTIFQVEDRFLITGRGLVFAGRILSGVIYTGDTILIDKDGVILPRKITGVEMVNMRNRYDLVGILIGCESEAEMLELRNWEMRGREFEVVKSICEILPDTKRL